MTLLRTEPFLRTLLLPPLLLPLPLLLLLPVPLLLLLPVSLLSSPPVLGLPLLLFLCRLDARIKSP